MNTISIPPIVMATLVFYVGFYHFMIYRRQKDKRENLTFALSCFSVGFYSILCAGLYSVSSPVEGVQWQRFQAITLAILGVALLWFINDYTGQTNRKIVIGFTVYYVFAALSGIFYVGDLIWTNEASIKEITLPFGYDIRYNEMVPGVLIYIQTIVGLIYFIYILMVSLKFYKSGNKRKGMPLLVAVVILFVGLMNDTFVSSGFYSFIYILEYSYIGIMLVFTYSLTSIIIKAGEIEIALHKNEKKYRRIYDNIIDVYYEANIDGIILEVSPSIEKYSKYKQEELIGKSLYDIYTKPEERNKLIEALINVGRVDEYELNLTDKDDTQRICSINAMLIKDENGNPSKIVGIMRDISGRKEAEKEKMELEEKLLRSKKMESLGLLAGGVAHDLNNVLSGIVGYPELLLLDLPEDSKLRKPIEIMQESGHSATAIVQDLLTVARGVATTKEALNLNDLIGDYLHSPEFNKLKQFHPTAAVKTNLNTDLLNISGSHVHIRKMVMNLVSNATEAIEGSGTVTISTTNRYVDRPLRGYDDVNIGEYAILSVSDDGSGISSDDLERIFEPFYTKKIMGRSGTGLGLAVVWNVVQDHKGYIDVKSGKSGTTFELYFPITRDEISNNDLSLPIKDYQGNQETILVVDDMESQQEISCKMLDKLGYKAKAVSSGEEAVEYLKENTVDLLLLDMIMDPGINGRETYERIIEIHPKQKAIIVSGFAETDEVREAQKIGAGQYIKKPVTLEKIGIAVKDELKK